jgi:hypothetical protein
MVETCLREVKMSLKEWNLYRKGINIIHGVLVFHCYKTLVCPLPAELPDQKVNSIRLFMNYVLMK